MFTYLYRLFNSSGDLLYVGITEDPKTRMIAHRTHQQWWPEVSTQTVESYSTWQEASDAETHAIALECPRYNKHPGNQTVRPTGRPKTRNPKTYQPLPQDEIDHMNGLPQQEMLGRARALYEAGWSLKALLPCVRVTPSSAWFVGNLWSFGSDFTGRPLPEFSITPTEQKLQDRKDREAYAMRKQLTPAEEAQLAALAPVVATYRPAFASTHPAAVAVGQYTKLIRDLKARGVRNQEMADAAGVSESNIRRRL